MGRGDSGEHGASEATSLVFRIATVGLSLASAIMTATSTQCLYKNDGLPAGTVVSYSDYKSFKYSAAFDLASAVLQGVAIYLEVVKKEKAAKAVERIKATIDLIDKVVQALTASSASLLLAVDDITSCGPPRGASRRRSSLCGDRGRAGRFCWQVRASSAVPLAATVSVSISVYTKHVPVSLRSPSQRTQATALIQSPPPVLEEEKKNKEE